MFVISVLLCRILGVSIHLTVDTVLTVTLVRVLLSSGRLVRSIELAIKFATFFSPPIGLFIKILLNPIFVN